MNIITQHYKVFSLHRHKRKHLWVWISGEQLNQTVKSQQVFEDISAPQTRINSSGAALKQCFQADSFEYNYVEFEDGNLLTQSRAMSDINGQICNSLAHFRWHGNKTNKFWQG